MHERVALIVNPLSGAGRARRRLDEVQRALASLGLPARTVLTRDIAHAARLGREAAAAGEIAVAFGGDGLIGAVAGGVREAGDRGLLGILPGGRGNDLARTLGIPSDPVAACRIVARGERRPLDLGAVDGRPFAGVASTGFDSEANRIANEARVVRGSLVYAYGALRALAAWKPAGFTLTLDGERHELRGYTVAVANSRYYGGGMQIAPAARLDDGLLDVVTIEQTSKLRFLAHLPDVFDGSHVGNEAVAIHRAREVRVEADRELAVYADGDPIARLPATIAALPAAVDVLAPAPRP